jgi:hypothetical protein
LEEIVVSLNYDNCTNIIIVFFVAYSDKTSVGKSLCCFLNLLGVLRFPSFGYSFTDLTGMAVLNNPEQALCMILFGSLPFLFYVGIFFQV